MILRLICFMWCHDIDEETICEKIVRHEVFLNLNEFFYQNQAYCKRCRRYVKV